MCLLVGTAIMSVNVVLPDILPEMVPAYKSDTALHISTDKLSSRRNPVVKKIYSYPFCKPPTGVVVDSSIFESFPYVRWRQD